MRVGGRERGEAGGREGKEGKKNILGSKEENEHA